MSKILIAFAKVLGKICFCLFFKDIGLVGRNTVPKFGFALVKIIDSRKIKIFLMPTEKSFP